MVDLLSIAASGGVLDMGAKIGDAVVGIER
jgi:hypothetical protein